MHRRLAPAHPPVGEGRLVAARLLRLGEVEVRVPSRFGCGERPVGAGSVGRLFSRRPHPPKRGGLDFGGHSKMAGDHRENLRILRGFLGLNNPIYARTAAYGHFGRTPDSDGGFSWEKLDLVDKLKDLAG